MTSDRIEELERENAELRLEIGQLTEERDALADLTIQHQENADT